MSETPSDNVLDQYRQCLNKNYPSHKLSNRGYCTAKFKFDVYPSAYANTYGSKVSRGEAPDFEGITKADQPNVKDPDSKLKRWWEEEWIDVCRPKPEGGYETCGRKDGKSGKYPYCRPTRRINKSSPKPVAELTQDEIRTMCKLKDVLPQGVEGKPTRIFISDVDRYKMSLENDMSQSPLYSDDIITNVDKIVSIINRNVNGNLNDNDTYDIAYLLMVSYQYVEESDDTYLNDILNQTVEIIDTVSSMIPEYKTIIDSYRFYRK